MTYNGTTILGLATLLALGANFAAANTGNSAADTDTVAQLGAAFGLRAFREIARSSPDCNVLFSPHGLAALMGMAQLGAADGTLRQLTHAMGYGLEDKGVMLALKHLQKEVTANSNQDIASTANAVFIQRNMKLPRAYVKNYRKAFNSRPKQLFFQDSAKAASIINKWVEAQTRGMISNFLRPDLLDPLLTRMVLVNAIYFKGLWKMPFDPEDTHHRTFYKADGTQIQVPMMSQITKLNFSEMVTASGMDYDVIELPYHGETFSMFIVAPYRKTDALSALTDIVSVELVNEWKNSLTLGKRQLVLPKFSLENEIDLRIPLARLGITDMFDSSKADFTKISKTQDLFVSQALQKVKIEVDERGTKASAATAAIMYGRMAMETVIIDRPFLFLVRHNPTGTILFMGQVMEP
ncbi:plasminogen activator inhibitor 1-like [Leucoraja erinacea]|uniref:plasminogen activator inhibitor 1-like n=1 Tax=Leucoraja erinaceus TaxID=7782 RepID=UPI002458C3CA|nr:plasminogen activator inhibitor 1-like [Leucoraja erinacea]